MPAVNFFVMAGLGQVWFGTRPTKHGEIFLGTNFAAVYAALLVTWYLLLAVRTRMVAWGLVMVVIVSGLCVAVNLYCGRLCSNWATGRR
jgi:hypothetical protein